jgi:PhnB protein
MSQQYLSTYINFQGRAREGLEFYHKALGGKVDLQNLRLDTDGGRILASDGHPKYPAAVGENVAIALGGSDKDRLMKTFNELGEGGNIKMPLTDSQGFLTDKFGINWVFSIDKA